MKEELLDNLTRLGIWLIVFFSLITIYMYSVRVGFLYNTVTRGVLILNVVKLVIMALAVASLFLLSKALAAAIVSSFLLALGLHRRFSGTEEIERYQLLVKYFLHVSVVVLGYFMLRGSVRTVAAGLGNYSWINLAFGLAWLAFGVTLAVFYVLRTRDAIPEIRELRNRRLAETARQVPATAAAGANANVSAKAGESAAAPVYCKKCGARLTEGVRFCKNCGFEV